MIFPNVNIKNPSCIFGCYPVHKDTFNHLVQTVYHYHYIRAIFSLKVTADVEINYEIDWNMNPLFIRYGQRFQNTVMFIFKRFAFFLHP